MTGILTLASEGYALPACKPEFATSMSVHSPSRKGGSIPLNPIVGRTRQATRLHLVTLTDESGRLADAICQRSPRGGEMMVNHYTKGRKEWTKKAWVDLKDHPDDIDLGYQAEALGVSRQKEGTVMFFDPDPESSGRGWIAMEPESEVIDNTAAVR